MALDLLDGADRRSSWTSSFVISRLFVDPRPVNSCSPFFILGESYFISYGGLKFAEAILSEMSFSSFGLVLPKFGPDEGVFVSLGLEVFVAIRSDL